MLNYHANHVKNDVGIYLKIFNAKELYHVARDSQRGKELELDRAEVSIC